MQPCFGTHETSSLCTVMLATVSGSCIARPRAHDNSCRPRHTHNGLGQLEMHSKLILLIIIVLAHHQGERGRQLMDYSYIVFRMHKRRSRRAAQSVLSSHRSWSANCLARPAEQYLRRQSKRSAQHTCAVGSDVAAYRGVCHLICLPDVCFVAFCQTEQHLLPEHAGHLILSALEQFDCIRVQLRFAL
jgi:hypothetical protein